MTSLWFWEDTCSERLAREREIQKRQEKERLKWGGVPPWYTKDNGGFFVARCV